MFDAGVFFSICHVVLNVSGVPLATNHFRLPGSPPSSGSAELRCPRLRHGHGSRIPTSAFRATLRAAGEVAQPSFR